MKSDTAGAGSGAPAEEEKTGDPVAGRLHTTSIGTNMEKSRSALVGDGERGSGCALVADGETQQGLWHEQQLRAGPVLAKEVWADDIA